MFALGVLLVLLGVLVSIALHEIGHLVPAKRFNIRVTQYMVGFGPTLWSRRRGETEYGLKAIPLGGYVRMIGMFPPARALARPGGGRGRGLFATLVEDARHAGSADVPPGEEARAFYAQSVPKRLVVMLAGPFMNLVIAVVLIAVVLIGFGAPTLVSTVGSVSSCVLPALEDRDCGPTDPVAPAAEAGLRRGDVVLAWDGRPVSTWDELSAAIRAAGTDPVEVVLERDGVEQVVVVTPVLVERPVVEDGQVVTDDAGAPVLRPTPFVGVGPSVGLVRQPASAVPGVVGRALSQTVGVVVSLPQRMVAVVGAAFGDGERDPRGVVGLVGVGRFAGEIASVDADQYTVAARVADLLALVATLNIALFVFNLIPLVPLDGGHVAGALWEGLRRWVARLRGRPDPGPVDVAKSTPLAYAVVVLMLGMGLLLAYADIVRPITLAG